jgi:hypothetical protein
MVMAQLKAHLVLLICGAMVAGCAEKWEKPGATKDEFDAMKAACQSKSYAEHPPMPRQVQLTAGYTTPIQTTCNAFGGSVSCFQTGGQYVPPVIITVDDNQNARNQDTRACFYENGWTPVKPQN